MNGQIHSGNEMAAVRARHVVDHLIIVVVHGRVIIMSCPSRDVVG